MILGTHHRQKTIGLIYFHCSDKDHTLSLTGLRSKQEDRHVTSLQLAGVGLVSLHELSDLLFLQRRVQNLVQSGVSLLAVDEVHELVQRDERLPLRATAAGERHRHEFRGKDTSFKSWRITVRRVKGSHTFAPGCSGSRAGDRGC